MFQAKKMKMMNTKIGAALAVSVAVTAALTGCGGGGGGGGGNAPAGAIDNGGSNPPKTDVTQEPVTSNNGITVDNAKSLVAAIPFALGAGSMGAPATQFSSNTASTSAKTLRTIVNAAPCGFPAVGGGGTTTVTFDDADNSGGFITAPDTLTMTYDHCQFPSSPEITNGTLQFTNTTVTGNPAGNVAPWTLKGTMTALSYSQTSPTESILLNGVLEIDDASADGKTEITTATSTNFSITRNADPAIVFTALTTHSTRVTSLTGFTDTSSSSGTAQIGGIGTVTMTTLAPWISNGDDEFPSQGSVKFVAANQSSVVVSAINAQTAKVEIDSNGDGQVDSVQEIPWTQL